VVIINIAFWALVYWTGVALAFARLRKDEKALLASYGGVIMLIPVGALLPRISGAVHVVQTLLGLTAFFAALVILLSFANRDEQHA
jgi:ABC-type Na+ efflux pump permease subunit